MAKNLYYDLITSSEVLRYAESKERFSDEEAYDKVRPQTPFVKGMALLARSQAWLLREPKTKTIKTVESTLKQLEDVLAELAGPETVKSAHAAFQSSCEVCELSGGRVMYTRHRDPPVWALQVSESVKAGIEKEAMAAADAVREKAYKRLRGKG